ncbi:Ig-like domain-containing protein [Salimicrobium halophilum]|uniref:SbsA Ig-like domain-containing protein n=1 Tax=Salimicrobium halophilum TaxID=86666 RepID=A0A1G8S4A8_9BACI|nr:Ig-like domain-containing protein [Salimicrobium halophilum]SDJ24046.1 hypothetical protein SAMN04490247_1246 [Salimicrobium halophilum]
MYKTYVTIFIVLLLGSFSVVNAEESMETVSAEKEWKVEFNTPVTLESAEEAISLRNTETQQEVSVTMSYGNKKSIVVINPPDQGYTYDTTYSIQVSDEIRSTGGVKAENTFSKDFVVEKDTFASWHSVRTLDMKNETVVHLLADEPAPEVTEDTENRFDEYDATFKLGLESSSGKKVMDFPFEENKNISFLHNDRENIESLFRKIDDQVFIYSERADSSLTEDYAFYVTAEDIKPLNFSFEDGNTSSYILNTLGAFESLEGNKYLQSTYNNAVAKTLRTVYELDEETLTFREVSALTDDEIEAKAERGYKNAHRIIYDDLLAVHNGLYENRDYSRIKEELQPFLTDSMITNLEDPYYSICVACDSLILSSDWSWDIHKNVLENTPGRVIVETAETTGNLTSGGFDTITIIKENGAWKLDALDHQGFDGDRNLDLSASEAKTVAGHYVNVQGMRYVGSSKETVNVYDGENYETTVYHFMYNGTEYKVKAATGKVDQVFE